MTAKGQNVLADQWLGRYQEALERARERAVRAASGRDLLAFGLTNNVDLVVWLDEPTIERLIDGQTIDWRGRRETRADSVPQLVRSIVQHVAAGQGTDLPVAEPAIQQWLVDRVSGRTQLGGTGAQAANTVTTLGFPTLVHLTGCSQTQADAFHVPELTRLARGGSLIPVCHAVSPGDQTMWHVALEYAAGLSFVVDGERIVAPAASRVIVSYDPVNCDFHVDPEFVDAVAKRDNDVRRVLISGYSQVVGRQALDRLIEQTVAATQRWTAARGDMVVHTELGAMPNPADLAGVVETIGLEVGSIGMNADELGDLLAVWDMRLADRPGAIALIVDAVRSRTLTRRVNVHTATHAVTMTGSHPEHERDALLFGALVASTRARIGTYPTFIDLEETLATNRPHPHGLEVLDDLALPDGIARLGGESLVVVPAIEIAHPAATVGLGDSFTGGLLAML